MSTPIKPENAKRYATSFGPNGAPLCVKRRSANRANPEKNVLNANVNAKNCHNSGPSWASLKESTSDAHLDVPPSSSGCGCGTTDGSRKYVHMMLVNDSAAAAKI